MREVLFTMDRPGLVEVGQKVEFTESKIPAFYYYTLFHAYAMSGNFMHHQRVKSREGVEKSIEKGRLGFDVIAEVDE